MTIIYLYQSLITFGGIERIFVDKMNYLAEKLNYKVYIVTWEQGNHAIVYPLSPKVTHIDLGILFYRQYQYGVLKRMYLQRVMEKELLRKLQDLVSSTHADIVIGTICISSVMNALSKLKGKTYTIAEAHNRKESIEKNTKNVRNPIVRWILERKNKQLYQSIKDTTVFVTLTNNDKMSWSNIVQANVIPNMLHYFPEHITQEKKTNKRVITVGRLAEQKGFDLLIDAWNIVHQKYPEWILDIYGNGDDKEKLINRIQQLNLKNAVIIHPPTPQIYERYMQSDFYIMSSRWEGFGLVLAEAMSCGIPCVSFDCPHGPSDIISDQEDGLLVENGNIEQLAEKICYLIEHEDIRKEMGAKARENVKRYLPENVMPQWEKLFKSITHTI